jgi:hypothetical protein
MLKCGALNVEKNAELKVRIAVKKKSLPSLTSFKKSQPKISTL